MYELRLVLAAAAASLLFTLSTDASAASVRIIDAWARPTPAGARVGAAYFTIVNAAPSPDRLIAAASPDAARTEIHQMSTDGGVMKMRPVEGGLPVPAGGSLRLAPGGYHIMLFGPVRPLVAGHSVGLELTFERAGKLRLKVPVKDAPGAMTPPMAQDAMGTMDMRADGPIHFSGRGRGGRDPGGGRRRGRALAAPLTGDGCRDR